MLTSHVPAWKLFCYKGTLIFAITALIVLNMILWQYTWGEGLYKPIRIYYSVKENFSHYSNIFIHVHSFRLLDQFRPLNMSPKLTLSTLHPFSLTEQPIHSSPPSMDSFAPCCRSLVRSRQRRRRLGRRKQPAADKNGAAIIARAMRGGEEILQRTCFGDGPR